MLCASCATVEANAPRAQAEAAHEPEADAAGRVVALDDRDLREVALGVGDDVAVALVRGGSVLAPVSSCSGTSSITRTRAPLAGIAKVGARERRDADAVAHPVGHRGRGERRGRAVSRPRGRP